MILIKIAIFFFYSSIFASSQGYDLKIDLSMNGKHVASPHLIVKAGEMSTVTQKNGNEESFIEVTAIENLKGEGILMNFTIGLIGKNGKRTILSRPQIVTKENETAQIAIGKEDGTEELSLSVIASKKSL